MKKRFDSEEKLLRQALTDLAQQEIRAARQDETLDAEYFRTLPAVRRHIARHAAPAPRLRMKALAIAAAVLVVFSGACVALPHVPEFFFDQDSVVDGIVNRKEIFEATCVADFRWNSEGELEMYQFVLKNPRGVQDDAYGNGDQQPAVTWTGKIAYILHKTTESDLSGGIEERLSYVPVSFAQSIAVHDDRVVMQELQIEGGACGPAYDINDQFRRTTAALTGEIWRIERPNSEAWYQQSFNNPGYAFVEGDAEAFVSTSGTFFYSAADDPAGKVLQAQTCRVELLDWN